MNLFPKIRHIHLVGIGGIGMSGIAEVLLNLGYHVSGSDVHDGAACRRLREIGADIKIGHRLEHLGDAQVVVTSSAIRGPNPEVDGAVAQGIPVIPRAEMLSELMRMKHGLAVAGAHGKTTTTSMLATCLAQAGLDPTVVIGGKLNSLGSNARLGRGEYLVAEADESDGSFLRLAPTLAIVTNIDPEHLDYYGSLDAIKRAFVTFANRVPFYGATLLCLDDPNIRGIIPEVRKRLVTFGLSPQADIRAESLAFEGYSSTFSVFERDRRLGQVRLGMPGRHNVVNALAAIAASLELDIPFAVLEKALEGFTGVHRRFQRKGEASGVLVVDDYGHHPTEIRATLSAARAGFPDRRLIVVFQPHRYSRTRDLFDDFVGAFQDVHDLVLTDIYPAGEAPLPGISSEQLALRIRETGQKRVSWIGDKEALPGLIRERVKAGDLLLTLGAGDVWKIGEAFLRSHGVPIDGSQA